MSSQEVAKLKQNKANAPRGHHGTDIVQDRGMKHGTPLQGTPMAGTETGNRFAYGRSDIWDSINAKGKSKETK